MNLVPLDNSILFDTVRTATPHPAIRSDGVFAIPSGWDHPKLRIAYIDGQNFLGKLEAICKAEKIGMPDWRQFNFNKLFKTVLNGLVIDESIFYFARIKVHPETREKSQQLIQHARELKTHLEHQDFRVILSGAVRGHTVVDANGKRVLVFKEKGVDVNIGVDMAVAACDGTISVAVLVSSDSDLQPAVRVLKARGVECIYLGFELLPNRGLMATTDRTILIRNSEVLECLAV